MSSLKGFSCSRTFPPIFIVLMGKNISRNIFIKSRRFENLRTFARWWSTFCGSSMVPLPVPASPGTCPPKIKRLSWLRGTFTSHCSAFFFWGGTKGRYFQAQLCQPTSGHINPRFINKCGVLGGGLIVDLVFKLHKFFKVSTIPKYEITNKCLFNYFGTSSISEGINIHLCLYVSLN